MFCCELQLENNGYRCDACMYNAICTTRRRTGPGAIYICSTPALTRGNDMNMAGGRMTTTWATRRCTKKRVTSNNVEHVPEAKARPSRQCTRYVTCKECDPRGGWEDTNHQTPRDLQTTKLGHEMQIEQNQGELNAKREVFYPHRPRRRRARARRRPPPGREGTPVSN